MRYFRHPPLAFWSAVLVLCAALVVLAQVSAPSNPSSTVFHPVRSDLVTGYRAMVKDLTLEVEADLATRESLSEWSKRASALAKRAQGQSSASMQKGWIEARLAAEDIAGLTELDSQAATRALKRVNSAADNLAALASTQALQPSS